MVIHDVLNQAPIAQPQLAVGHLANSVVVRHDDRRAPICATYLFDEREDILRCLVIKCTSRLIA